MIRALGATPDLDRDSAVPAHAQIETWLVEQIDGGGVRPGDRLPGERDLAARLGVSRMTLRQALAGLERRGVLVRHPGRAGGAFVAEPQIECDLTGLAGFTEVVRRANARPGARLLSARTLPAVAGVAARLELAEGDLVHEVRRIRTANRAVIALERSYLPADLFPDLLDQGLRGSLYQLIATRYGQRPHTAVERLEAVAARPDEAAALGVEIDAPLMLIERTAHSVAGRPLEFARDLFRPDRVRIVVRSGVDQPSPVTLQAALP
jgi:GntR family transcriptional regulator